MMYKSFNMILKILYHITKSIYETCFCSTFDVDVESKSQPIPCCKLPTNKRGMTRSYDLVCGNKMRQNLI